MLNWEEFFAELNEHTKKRLPFVAYRKPVLNKEKEPGITRALLQEDSKIHKTIQFTESGFVFAPFEENRAAYYIPQESSKLIKTRYTGHVDKEKVVKKEKPDFPPEQFMHEEKADFEKIVQKSIEEIEAGRLKKVVLSRREEVETQLGTLEIFKELLKKYPSAFVYIWFHPETDTWLGATPEALLSVERDQFQTMSLAGTQVYKGFTEVSWGEKEIEEQKIVTDSILDNLQKIAAEDVQNSEAYTSRAGNLLHLRTDVKGKFRGNKTSLADIIRALHPTPAVCGLPKKEAREFIIRNESYDREFYTGFLGELNFKKEVKRNSNRRNQENQAYASISSGSFLFVNLRCVKIEDDEAYIFVGGGITKDSDPVKEFEETVNKAQTIKAVLVK